MTGNNPPDAHPSLNEPGRVPHCASLDLGPRQGARGPSTVHVSDQHRCLLLRSAKSMAARFQREHQWSAETVFSERSRLVGVLASPLVFSLEPRCHGRSEEHTSELQSHLNLVCRLLLEKKKTKQTACDKRIGDRSSRIHRRHTHFTSSVCRSPAVTTRGQSD